MKIFRLGKRALTLTGISVVLASANNSPAFSSELNILTPQNMKPTVIKSAISTVAFNIQMGSYKGGENSVFNNGGNVNVKGTFDNKGQFKNTGSLTVGGQITSSGTITNSGDITLNGGGNISGEFTQTGGSLTVGGDKSTVLDGNISGGSVKVSEGGTLDFSGKITGDDTNLEVSGNMDLKDGEIDGKTDVKAKGKLTVSGGKLTLDSSDKIESGGEIDINGGEITLNGFKTEEGGGSLKIKSGDFTIGESGYTMGNEGDELGENLNVTLNGDLTVNKGKATLDSNDTLTKGKVSVSDKGKLTLDNVSTNDNVSLNATGGELTLKNATLNNKSDDIQEGAKVTIEDGLTVKEGKASFDFKSEGEDKDSLSGTLTQTGGEITLKGLTTESDKSLNSKGGKLTVNGDVTLNNEDDIIDFDTETNIEGNITVQQGKFSLDNKDKLTSGKITLNGENATLGVNGIETGDVQLNLEKGNLHIYDDGLTLSNSGDEIKKDIVTLVEGNLNIEKGKAYLNEKDTWKEGTIDVSSEGSLQFDNFNATSAQILKTEDNANVELLNSNVSVSDAHNISGGTITLDDNSTIAVQSGDYTLKEMKTSGMVNSTNGEYQTHKSGDITILSGSHTTLDNNTETTDGKADFSVDIFARANYKQNSDSFSGNNLKVSEDKEKGTINISDWTLNGNLRRHDAPIDRYYEFQLFDYDKINENVIFSATDKEVFTPIGNYRLFAQGNGKYVLALTSYNPQVFRAQVTTLAQYNNVLSNQDLVTNHIILHNERKLADMGNNRYAAATPTLGPYLYSQEDGGVWMKGYGDFEKLSMGQGLDVDNMAYGSIFGADFSVVNLKNGWKFIPTAFMGYNGAHQTFKGVTAYQNGGQLGFMGTFMKNNYISSHTVYGGGYYNEMHVDGVEDETGNWFWGTAHRFAYNWNIKRKFILQPSAFLSYNMFGSQNFHSEFGEMGMRSGMLNGVNIAPALNLIYLKNDWSLYAGVQYMWNINEQVSGKAGNVYIPNLNMRHGYIQYGLGASKNIKENLSGYAQVMFRNGGRTGIACQAGLEYFFDIKKIKTSFENKFLSRLKITSKK